MIRKKTKNKLVDINDLRKKYVHFKEATRFNPPEDAKKARAS
jgi:hypothetical protein